MYLHHVQRQTTFTAAELHEAAEAAQTWYNEHLPNDVLAERAAILARHGFNDETWREVISQAHSFYFIPTDEEAACNCEMQALMSNQFIVNSRPIYRNYLHACVSNAFKRGVLLRDESTSPYIYRINPAFVNHPDFPRS